MVSQLLWKWWKRACGAVPRDGSDWVNIVSSRVRGMDGEEAEMNGFATDWLYEQGSPLRWHRRQTGWAWSHCRTC